MRATEKITRLTQILLEITAIDGITWTSGWADRNPDARRAYTFEATALLEEELNTHVKNTHEAGMVIAKQLIADVDEEVLDYAPILTVIQELKDDIRMLRYTTEVNILYELYITDEATPNPQYIHAMLYVSSKINNLGV